MYRKLQRNLDVVHYLLHNASPTQWTWRVNDRSWTLGEIVCHLRDVERQHTRLQLAGDKCRRSLAGGGDGASLAGGYSQALADYARYRLETMKRLKKIPSDQWQGKVARGEQRSQITPTELVSRINCHDRLHIKQIEYIIRAMPLNPLLARALSEISEYHRLYQPHLARAASLLDIGVGTGLALRHVMQHNPHLAVAGVDIRDLRLAGVKVPLQIYDGHTLPFDDNQFDMSLLFYVLHHCQNLRRLLAEAVRVTRRKLIVIEEFSPPSIDRVSLDLTERQSHRALGMPADLPYQLFNQTEFKAMARAYNLHLLEEQYLRSQTTRPVQKYLYVLTKD